MTKNEFYLVKKLGWKVITGMCIHFVLQTCKNSVQIHKIGKNMNYMYVQ